MSQDQKKHIFGFRVLGPVQTQILLSLANIGPQTINENAKKIKKTYHPTYNAFKSLQRARLISKTSSTKLYRGQEYPRFWLTLLGVINTISAGVKPNILINGARKAHPEDTTLIPMIECISSFPKGLAENIVLTITPEGKMNQSLFFEIILTYIAFMNPSQRSQVISAFNKFIDQNEDLRRNYASIIDESMSVMKTLKDSIEK